MTLIIPGIDGSGPAHWQTLWQAARPDCVRVELGDWDRPDPMAWIDRLDGAVLAHAGAPVFLVGHSLGCILVAWWVHYRPASTRGVSGAMLVAPCNPASRRDGRLRRFAPYPGNHLPFPAAVVASQDDPYAAFEWSARFAHSLGADLVDAGYAGHINAEAGFGVWQEGQALLDRLIAPRSEAAGRLRLHLDEGKRAAG